MAIAVRNVNDGEWKKILSRVKLENSAVQELIHDFPELVSVEDSGNNGSNIVVCIRNPFKNGSESNSGLIGIDDNGMITIVECKVANDPNVRKEVVGQAMEYAANLWEMTYEDFDELVMKSEGSSLVQIVGQKTAAERWSADEFIESVKAVLRQGISFYCNKKDIIVPVPVRI